MTDTSAITAGKSMKAIGVTPSIVLCNPLYARNVSMVIRLAANYYLPQVWYTGDRVSIEDPSQNVEFPGDERHSGLKGKRKKGNKARLPREERMRGFDDVELHQFDYPFDHFPGCTPVAVELKSGAELLPDFEHPEKAIYVFGPEDGSLQAPILRHCHRFVIVPTRYCLNLAMAVGTVLYDRMIKMGDIGEVSRQ